MQHPRPATIILVAGRTFVSLHNRTGWKIQDS